MIGRDDAISGRQGKLLVRGSGQALELIEVETLYLLPRLGGFFEELDTGINARIIFKTVDIQIGKQDLETIMLDELRDHSFQANPV
jgi:hypothetical protein